MTVEVLSSFLSHGHRPDKISERKEVLLLLSKALGNLGEKERYALDSLYGIWSEPVSDREAAKNMPGGKCSPATIRVYRRKAERAVFSFLNFSMGIGISRANMRLLFNASLAEMRSLKQKSAALEQSHANDVRILEQEVLDAKQKIKEAHDALRLAELRLAEARNKSDCAQAAHDSAVMAATKRAAELGRSVGVSFSPELYEVRKSIIEEREWLARTTLLNASAETVNRLVQSGEGIDMFGHLEMEP
tara:strand:+ start:962 stop:1702 length:741 start_codon:yes stop_codon:yes gene_type:complete